MTELRVAPCSHEAAKHAVLTWHYSRRMPAGKVIQFGVWENGSFIGAVLFGRGANNNLGEAYGLDATEVCELVRVALTQHRSHVSQIVAVCLSKLRASNPGLRLVVSYADPNHQHHGGIYQAGNWIYSGATAKDAKFIDSAGREWHSRLISSSGTKRQFGAVKKVPRPSECKRIDLLGKYRYLMPLDKAMRRRVSKLALPYPEAQARGSGVVGDAVGFRPAEAGSTPANRSKASA